MKKKSSTTFVFIATMSVFTLVSGCARSDSGSAADSGVPSSTTAGATLLFEGARLIVGDGSVVENGALLRAGWPHR